MAHRPIGSGVQATGATQMGTRPWAGRTGAVPEQGEAGGHGAPSAPCGGSRQAGAAALSSSSIRQQQ